MSKTNPLFICKLPSGDLFLSDMQFLRGYCILVADPIVTSINDLSEAKRSQFLTDRIKVGDVLLTITDAYRINYAIAGNSDPVLHAHIVPRYPTEPEEYIHGLPWSYPDPVVSKDRFNPDRDGELIKEITRAMKNSST